MNKLITKSNYLAGLQCPKRFWAEFNCNNIKIDITPAQQRIINQGLKIGEYAHTYFPKGLLIQSKSNTDALAETEQAIQEGSECIFEPAFMFNDILIRCDVLQQISANTWAIIEVKSSSKVKDEHIDDLAIQKYVLTGNNINISETKLMLINTKNCYYPNLENLFVIEDITLEVNQKIAEVSNNITDLKNIAKLPNEPNLFSDKNCGNPDKCPLKYFCWQGIPEISIFTIPRLHKSKSTKLIEDGIFALDDLPNYLQNKSNKFLTDNQKKYVNSILNNQLLLDENGIKNKLDELEYPLYFFDIETHNPAIPRFDGLKPYEQFIFQYSCHVLSKNGQLEHFEYLHTENTDPRLPLIKSLIKHIKKTGSVIVYHLSFEASKLKKLAEDFPEYAEQLNSIVERLWDLEIIFKHFYKHPQFLGKTSIKKVLPVLVPTLSYDNLNVKRGDEAQTIWDEIITTQDLDNKQKMIKDLKDYCQLDTQAMVQIYQKLNKII